MKVKTKRLNPDARLPYYDHPGDAGLAMHCLEGAVLQPGERYKFDCGWALEFDEGHVALVLDRSSMGVVKGLKTMGGVFDATYRGEYNVCLVNLSPEPYEVKKGDKIAQLVILPIVQAEITEVEELSESVRGTGSFGSTGR
jgi:dUTP pyrophosphatase